MANKKELEHMIDNLLDGENEKAQMNFHTFLKAKMADIVEPEPSEDLEDLGEPKEDE